MPVAKNSEATTPPKWTVHIIGPDDVIPCDSEIDALRRANEHNKLYAEVMVNEASPNDPYTVAVAKNSTT
jgi:hypothetical protein